ncbi:conserved hypothetical protein [Ricinus communis]|uniref:Uncharacterized protein n=1 Tax=Ricinus communis TaxID=3988 RepID=B9RSK1_RICCO|nr:conserved hypothetical protein [Ricinus communis]
MAIEEEKEDTDDDFEKYLYRSSKSSEPSTSKISARYHGVGSKIGGTNVILSNKTKSEKKMTVKELRRKTFIVLMIKIMTRFYVSYNKVNEKKEDFDKKNKEDDGSNSSTNDLGDGNDDGVNDDTKIFSKDDSGGEENVADPEDKNDKDGVNAINIGDLVKNVVNYSSSLKILIDVLEVTVVSAIKSIHEIKTQVYC